MDHFIFIIEIIGTIAFAISGALTGFGKNMDIFGVSILGVTTATGGGDTRFDSRSDPARDLLESDLCIIVGDSVDNRIYFRCASPAGERPCERVGTEDI